MMMVVNVMTRAMMAMVVKMMMMMVMRLFYRNEADAGDDGWDTCHMG